MVLLIVGLLCAVIVSSEVTSGSEHIAGPRHVHVVGSPFQQQLVLCSKTLLHRSCSSEDLESHVSFGANGPFDVKLEVSKRNATCIDVNISGGVVQHTVPVSVSIVLDGNSVLLNRTFPVEPAPIADVKSCVIEGRFEPWVAGQVRHFTVQCWDSFGNARTRDLDNFYVKFTSDRHVYVASLARRPGSPVVDGSIYIHDPGTFHAEGYYTGAKSCTRVKFDTAFHTSGNCADGVDCIPANCFDGLPWKTLDPVYRPKYSLFFKKSFVVRSSQSESLHKSSVCRPHEIHVGRWVKHDECISQSSKYGLALACENGLTDSKGWRWQPFNCTLEFYNADRIRQCMHRRGWRKIYLVGDSSTRDMFEDIVKVMYNSTAATYRQPRGWWYSYLVRMVWVSMRELTSVQFREHRYADSMAAAQFEVAEDDVVVYAQVFLGFRRLIL